MPEYRIYTLNKENHIIKAEQAVFSTDHDALLRAADLITQVHGAEIWQADRLVARLAPQPNPSPSN